MLRRISNSMDRISILGDLDEDFHEITLSNGRIHGVFWYLRQIIILLATYSYHLIYWRCSMIKNYLKVAFRNLWRFKGYAFINIIGLSFGLACCLLIFVWVQDEFAYDRFHEKGHLIHKVYSMSRSSGGTTTQSTTSYYPMAKLLQEECPGVEVGVRYRDVEDVRINHGEKSFPNIRVGFADANFFQVFTFPFLEGNPETAFEDLFSCVITESMAERYFGFEDPLGKRLSGEGFELLVTGVLKDVPHRSSLLFDCLVPFTLMFGTSGQEPTHWGGNPLTTFVLLNPGARIPDVEQKITECVHARRNWEQDIETFHLQSLRRMHLYNPDGGGIIVMVRVFSLIAFLVLIIACMNFMNLSTARSATRSKEVGMRKAIGAGRGDLIRQFFGESILIAFIAMLIGVLIMMLYLPVFNGLVQKQLNPGMLIDPKVILGFTGIALFTGIAAGSYPAIVLSAFQPADVVRGTGLRKPRGAWFRRMLVVGQFWISVMMLISTLFVHRQMHFILSTDYGFDKDAVVGVIMNRILRDRYPVLKTELMRHPDVRHVTRSFQNPVNIGSTVSAVDWTGKNPSERAVMHWDYVALDFFETMGMEILDGRPFLQDFPADLKDGYIVNEAAVMLMGMDDPIGQPLSVFHKEGRIIGVVKDFHFRPFYYEIKPFVFMPMEGDMGDNLFIRLEGRNLRGMLDYIRSVCARLDPDNPTRVYFFNDALEQYIYTSENQIMRIAENFTALAILISCLGLFGLAAFVAERRTKEIGIRKVLGASITDVVMMLSRDFLKWVLFANLLAWPAAVLLVRIMLERYAYRTSMGVEVFAAASVAALIIALMTVSFQAIRASRAKPVDTLKYE